MDITTVTSKLNKINNELAVSPNDLDLQLRKAAALRELGFLKGDRNYVLESLALLDKMLRNAPENPNIWLDRGITHYTLDNQDLAIADYSHSLELEETARAYYNRGVARWHKAESKGVNNIRNDPETHKLMEESMRDYEKTIVIDPSFQLADYNRGMILIKLERYQEALSELNSAGNIDPSDHLVFYFKGVCYENLGSSRYSDQESLQHAIQNYSTGIRLNPSFLPAFYNRAICFEHLSENGRYGNRENIKKAINDYNEILRQEPQNDAIYYNRGWAYEHLGEIEHAIEDYKMFIQLSSDGFTVGQVSVHLENLISRKN